MFSKKTLRLLLGKFLFGGYLIKSMVLHILKRGWIFLLAALLLLGGFSAYRIFQPLPDNFQPPDSIVLRVPVGASFRQVADSLLATGALTSPRLFILLGKISGKEREIRSGVFKIPLGLTAWQLLNKLKDIRPHQIKITFPEGLLSHQMARIASKTLGADSAAFVRLVYDSAFANELVPGESNLEGFLLPETYFFEWKTPASEIIRHLVGSTLKIFEPDSVQLRLKEFGWSYRQLLTLASIIEGEVLVDSEAVYVSSLYHNRLRLGWPLQADPTIQFIIPGPPRRLLNKDLEVDSPYNTYKYRGLPPGPINNPGKNSILAALFPVESKYLYMVAAGDGRHKFSRTLKEHNYWHKKFNQVRRKVRRQQRLKKLQQGN